MPAAIDRSWPRCRTRALRLDISASRIFRAALAILDSRLTGNVAYTDTAFGDFTENCHIRTTGTALLDDWLTADIRPNLAYRARCGTSPQVACRARSGLGRARFRGARRAPGLPIVWFLESGDHITLSANYLESSFDEPIDSVAREWPDSSVARLGYRAKYRSGIRFGQCTTRSHVGDMECHGNRTSFG